MSDPSIAVVVLDTLRKDTFSRYFEWLPGTRFTNAYSTSHWTVPAHASLLTGLYASEVGVHGKSRTFDYPDETIVESLQRVGYSTHIWTANMQIHAWDGWDRGFGEVLGPDELRLGAERSVSWADFDSSGASGKAKYMKAIWFALMSSESTIKSLQEGYHKFMQGPGERGAEKLLHRLKNTTFGDREFLLMNLMESHTPHYPAEPYRSFDEEIDFKIGDAFGGLIDDPDRNRRAYDDSAAYLSTTYKEIFGELKDEFDIVITISDHGELLGEYDMWNHGYGIYPQLAHIPFVVWSTDEYDISGDAVREDVVSILDIPATLSTIVEMEYECRGKDLFSNTDSIPRLVEYHGFLPWHREQLEAKGAGDVFHTRDKELNGIVRRDGKYIFETHDQGYICPTGEPTEEDETVLEDLVSSLSKRSVSEETTDVSSAVKARLEELGYA